MGGLVSAVGYIEDSALVVRMLLSSGVVGNGNGSDCGDGLHELVLITTGDVFVGGDLGSFGLVALFALFHLGGVGIPLLADGSTVILEILEHIVHPSTATSTAGAVYEVLLSEVGELFTLCADGGLESSHLR